MVGEPREGKERVGRVVKMSALREENQAILVVEGLRKSFGATKALNGLDLTFSAGRVHAVVGENGAGKSTLVKTLSGVVAPDSGVIKLAGKTMRLKRPRDALGVGISTAFQELSLVKGLTVAENLLFGQEPIRRSRAVARSRLRKAAHDLLGDLGITTLDVDADVEELTLSDQQRLEIARAITRPKADVVLLDEPTSSLGPTDVDWLMGQIERLRERGAAVVFVSHRLNEIARISDTISILRDGRNVETVAAGTLSEPEIVERMIGRKLEGELRAVRSARPPIGAPRLVASGICLKDGAKPMSLTVCAGEIVGVAALAGQGQRDLFEILAGLRSAGASSVMVDGRAARRQTVKESMRLGIGLVPERRKEEGLFLGLPIKSNASIASLRRWSRLGWIRRKRESRNVGDALARLGVPPKRMNGPVDTLSGGNQQKVVFAKWLLRDCGVLMLFDPTRGVDVGASADVLELVRNFSADGGSVLMYSSELPELLAIADRIVILYGHEAVATARADAIAEAQLLEHMLGLTTSGDSHSD